jgi:hypothetical protein
MRTPPRAATPSSRRRSRIPTSRRRTTRRHCTAA